MATQILMPALSPTMTEGKLARWLKDVGDDVRAGDVIAEIETDKATMEVEAVDEGKLARILVDEGTEGVAVNTPIAVLRMNGEDVSTAPHRLPKAAAPAPAQGAGTRDPRVLPKRPAPPHRPAGRAGAGEGLGTDQADHGARGVARCDGAGDAARRRRVPDRRGSRAVPGRLQDQPGPAGRVRRQAGHRYADHRAWLHRHGGRRGAERAAADRRVHDVQLRHAGDGPDHQLGGQDAVHVGRPDGLPDRVPRAERRGVAGRARSTRSATRVGTRMCRG